MFEELVAGAEEHPQAMIKHIERLLRDTISLESSENGSKSNSELLQVSSKSLKPIGHVKLNHKQCTAPTKISLNNSNGQYIKLQRTRQHLCPLNPFVFVHDASIYL